MSVVIAKKRPKRESGGADSPTAKLLLSRVIRSSKRPDKCPKCGATFFTKNCDGDWECFCGKVIYA